MNFIQLFQKYHSFKTDSMKSNTLYKPSQSLIVENPVKKYTMPPDFFSKKNIIPSTNSNNTAWRKIMYINTDLEYNFDDQVSQENALINLNKKQNQVFIKPKILSYILSSLFVVIPFTYYVYNSQSFQTKK
jgi:hypothetical protein